MPPLQIQKTKEEKRFKGLHYEFAEVDGSFSGTKEFLIVTADSKFVPVITFLVGLTQAVDFDIFENTIVTANGTERSVVATNRNNLVAPLTKIFESPTITADGDMIVQRLFNPNIESFGLSINEEIVDEPLILKPATNYLLRIVSLAGNNRFQLIMLFFEEDIETL